MTKIDHKLVLAQTRQLTLLYVEDDDTLREERTGFFRNFFAVILEISFENFCASVSVVGQVSLAVFMSKPHYSIRKEECEGKTPR